MAEVGVILLLFTIGLEFSLEKLGRIRAYIVTGGGLQVGLTVAAVTGMLALAGVAFPSAIFTGFLVALSSTAIVLKLLADRRETDTPSGRLSLAVLIFQDLAIIGMVLLVPMLSGRGGTWIDAILALGKSAVIIGVTLVVARKIVPAILGAVARAQRPDLFLLTVVLICLGTAWTLSLFDVSLALGAFLAGLLVSESRYSSYALSEVLPLRMLFNAVFFVSVGMLLDVGFLVGHLPLVLAATLGVLVLKAVLTSGAVLALRYPVRVAVVVGIGLAQIGEFSFVLQSVGLNAGLTPMGLGETGTQYFIAVTVLLMTVTPFLVRAAPAVGGWIQRSMPAGRAAPADAPPETQREDHVIVVGYGAAGQRLAHVLGECGLGFVVVELNPVLVDLAREEGVPVIQGDAGRPHMLQVAGIERAKLLVSVINDENATLQIVRMVQHLSPTTQVVVRTRFLQSIEPLQRAGADIVVPEELETTVRLFSHVLGAYLIPPEEIERQTAALRSADYRLFRGSIQEAHLMVLQGLDEEGLHTRAVGVRPGAPAAGRTLTELALRRDHNLTVLAVRREGRTIGNPSGDFRVEPGDRLVLVGTANQFAASAALWRTPGDATPKPGV
jgi:CPA2 family monovalent cation:H+ antiporter-2